MWVVNFTAQDTTAPTVINVTFELSSTVQQYSTVGTWVYQAPNSPDKFQFQATTGIAGEKGVLSTGTVSSNSQRPALSHFVFAGELQPDVISMPKPPASLACDISGQWVQDRSNQVFTVHMAAPHRFNLTISPKDAHRDGWAWANGTTSADNRTFELSYFRPKSSPGAHGFVFEKGHFFGDCQHAHVGDSPWHRPGAPPPAPSSAPVPSATFTNLHLPVGQPVTLRVVLSIGANASALATTEAKVVAGFDTAFEEAHSAWERRWMQVMLYAHATMCTITEPCVCGAGPCISTEHSPNTIICTNKKSFYTKYTVMPASTPPRPHPLTHPPIHSRTGLRTRQ